MIKSNVDRVIESPGYHIKPKYDMVGLRLRRSRDGSKDTNVVLPLTSMIDMFSMLVVFLIMNFSSTGEAFYKFNNIKLPKVSNAQEIESLPLVSISKDTVTFNVERVGNNPLNMTEKDRDLPRLRMALRKVKSFKEALNPDKPFKGRVNIQADKDTAVVYVKRVMTTLIEEGWNEINFLATPSGEASSQKASQ